MRGLAYEREYECLLWMDEKIERLVKAVEFLDI